MFTNEELQNVILRYLPIAKQNTYRMYGTESICNTFTIGHAMDGGKPDEIIRRHNLFLLYTKMSLELIQLANAEQLPINKEKQDAAYQYVKSIVKWGVEQGDLAIHLDGVFAFCTAVYKGARMFSIPIKWLPNELDTGIAYLIEDNDSELKEKAFVQKDVLFRYLSNNNNYVLKKNKILSVKRLPYKDNDKMLRFIITYR